MLHTGSFEHKMDGLAGYDSSSSTEDDKIQRKLAPKEVRNVRLRCIYKLTLFLCHNYVVLLRRKGGICADLYQMHNSWCCILWWVHRHHWVLLQRKTYLIKGYGHQKILARVAKLIFCFIKIRSCYLSVLTPKTVTEIQLFLDGLK